MSQVLENRIKELKAAIEKSASATHALHGRLVEAQWMLENLSKIKEEEEVICED